MQVDKKKDNKKMDKRIQNLAKPKESDIEKHLVRIVWYYSGEAIKIQGVGNKSLPDRMCIFPGGKTWFVETKKPGKKPNVLQLATHAKLEEMGFNVRVIWNKEQLKQFRDEISGA